MIFTGNSLTGHIDMTDLALDPRTRDLAFSRLSNGKLALRPIRGADEVGQRIGIHLRTWIGEWFLDSTHGVPYLESVLGHNRRKVLVEAVLRSHILSVDGVDGINSFTLDLDRANRTLAVTWEAHTAQGLARGTLEA